MSLMAWLQCGPGSLAGVNVTPRRFTAGLRGKLQCGPGSLAGENLIGQPTPDAELFTLQCGPGSLAGENARSTTIPRNCARCFNAAPARSPGRTWRLLLTAPNIESLQCGPGSLAGENRSTAGNRCHSWEASMRPRLARRGELVHDGGARLWWCALQCGPGSLAGENSATRKPVYSK